MSTDVLDQKMGAARFDASLFDDLRNPATVRQRCAAVYRWIAEGRSTHFILNEGKLTEVARYVAAVSRAAYPDLAIPYHSRWRHFAAGDRDRYAELSALLPKDKKKRAASEIDLAVISVLLDAGAGDEWSYYEVSTGTSYRRSEGIAVASLDAFCNGAFSSDPADPYRVDASALQAINDSALERLLQVSSRNKILGLPQRADLLRRLGSALESQAGRFGPDGRPGQLVWTVGAGAVISAPALLATLLEAFASIWPSGLVYKGYQIGDAGIHRAGRTDDPTSGIVPFHKLSQWLVYSLVEPFERAEIRVDHLDQLTGLPEYRNGGLFLDFGVLEFLDDAMRGVTHQLSSELVVEWRAGTIVLLDKLLPLVRCELGKGNSFLLPHMLQGGTWAAGRKIALELRPPHGPSPLALAINGTTF